MKLLIFSLLLLLSACHKSNSDLADNVIYAYVKKAPLEKYMALEGSGGSMMDDIKKLHMSFVCTKFMTLEEARKLIVKIANQFVNHINAYEEIRPRLHNYPFQTSNVSIMIRFCNENNKRPSKQYVAFVSLSKDRLLYAHWDDARPLYDEFCNQHKETFEEAIKLVAEQENLPSLPNLTKGEPTSNAANDSLTPIDH